MSSKLKRMNDDITHKMQLQKKAITIDNIKSMLEAPFKTRVNMAWHILIGR